MGREFSRRISYLCFLLGPLLPWFPPFSLPFLFPSPAVSGLDFSPGGGPTQWVRKCLCGCVECGTCPTYRDLELSAIAMRWINLLPGLSAPAEVFCSLGGHLWGLSHTLGVGMSCAPEWSPAQRAGWGVLLGSRGDASPALSWAGSCWQLCQAAGGFPRPASLTGAPPLSLMLRLEGETPCKLSEEMDWLWILLTRAVVEEFCRGLSSGQDFSRCWGLPEASFHQAESSLSALPVMTLDEKTFFFKQ